VLVTLHLVVGGNLAFSPSFNPMVRGFGPDILMVMIVGAFVATPGLVVLVLLSPPSINHYSIDALLYRRGGTTFAPLPPAPAAVPTAEAAELTERDIIGPE
jgi:hypothetical protein